MALSLRGDPTLKYLAQETARRTRAWSVPCNHFRICCWAAPRPQAAQSRLPFPPEGTVPSIHPPTCPQRPPAQAYSCSLTFSNNGNTCPHRSLTVPKRRGGGGGPRVPADTCSGIITECPFHSQKCQGLHNMAPYREDTTSQQSPIPLRVSLLPLRCVYFCQEWVNTLPFPNFLAEWGVQPVVTRTHEAGARLCGPWSSVSRGARLNSFRAHWPCTDNILSAILHSNRSSL